jgi:hypothetical protein
MTAINRIEILTGDVINPGDAPPPRLHLITVGITDRDTFFRNIIPKCSENYRFKKEKKGFTYFLVRD